MARELIGKEKHNYENCLFECPRACGWVDMTFAELDTHI